MPAGAARAVADNEAPAPALPTRLARRFVGYVLGFGVAVGAGLAPFLGKVRVPGFAALLGLFPESLQGSMIPLSAFLMGFVAVAVQFYSGESVPRAALRRRFKWGAASLLAGLALTVALYGLLVIRVPIEGGQKSLPIVVALSRTAGCPCPSTDTDGECIAGISFQPQAIESCWGSRPLALSRLALTFCYLLLTGGFGALIGILLLQEEGKKKAADRRGR